MLPIGGQQTEAGQIWTETERFRTKHKQNEKRTALTHLSDLPLPQPKPNQGATTPSEGRGPTA